MIDQQRRWWQFRISTILLWMVIAALTAGWFADRQRHVRELDAMRVQMENEARERLHEHEKARRTEQALLDKMRKVLLELSRLKEKATQQEESPRPVGPDAAFAETTK